MTKSEELAVRRIVREEIAAALKDLADTTDLWDGTVTGALVRETVAMLQQEQDKSDDSREGV